MSWLLQNLPVLPIAIPMLTGGIMLLTKEKRRFLNTLLSFFSVVALLFISISFLLMTTDLLPSPWEQNIAVYLLGNWQAPFGIVLVVDQLSALMLCLTSFLGICSLTYVTAFWNRAGVHYYPLFQFILMGLSGAFLTGDLFNLFVFFEIFLAASYGLLLHGSGQRRVSASMHYITVNLIGAFLLLLGISMIYAITGTLNMADLTLKAGELQANDRMLFETACSLLGLAFLIKGAAWPLNFWLPNAYYVASAPVAAMFAVMTKVGVYALLRVGSLLSPTGAPAAFGGEWMYFIGVATILFGTLGLLAEQQLGRLVGFSVIVSSGILLACIGLPGIPLTGAALYYMVSSVFTTSAFYLLVELISRIESHEKSLLNVSMELFGLDQEETSDYSGSVVGVPVPAAMAFLGLAFFVCSLVIAGLPPLSGFVGKFAILSLAMDIGNQATPTFAAWLIIIAVLASGLAAIISFCRAGIHLFWIPDNLKTPVLSLREAGPIALLLTGCVLMSIFANPVIEFMNQIAVYLSDPFLYTNAVMKVMPLTGGSI